MAPKKNGSIHRNELLAKLVTGNKAPCAFCQRKVDDEVIFGKLYAIGDIQCHYFCVLLSSCLVQRGRDEDGLFGFLYANIVAEVERSKKHRCSFCGRMGATLGCSISQCKKQFHLPCGRERHAISLFYGNYKSFCNQHAPKQSIPDNIMINAKLRMNMGRKKNGKVHSNFNNLKELSQITVGDDTQTIEKECVCVICYEEVEGYPTSQTFWPPCCARDAWFHRSCLQRMALSAGMHYLKCPLCNDKDHFYQAVVSQGYYVPDRDAAWELEQNAFAEIYERPISCDAEECKCPMGRSHDADAGEWDLKLCILCGSSGLHLGCSPDSVARHVCRVCRPAAPHDIDLLANTIQQVILAEQSQNTSAVRSGPIMPSRMSLRRTKQRNAALNIASSSTSHNVAVTPNVTADLPSSRQDLNLKTPRKLMSTDPTSPLKSIENKTTPIKLFQQGLYNKIQTMGLKNIEMNNHVLEVVRRKFQKPKPLCVKKRIVNDLLDGLFDNLLKEHKKKELLKEWNSPVKCSNAELGSEEPLQHLVEESTECLDDHSTKVSPQKKQDLDQSNTESICELTEQKIDQESSYKCLEIPQELQIFDTPKKLKTVDIQKDSSLEISANDEVINIDVVKMENGQTGDQLLETPVKLNKCVLKFSPSDKVKLKSSNIDMDLESFKNQYLNEVDRYKCNFNHKHIKTDANESKLRTAIDFAIDATSRKEKGATKRKLDGENRCVKKRKVDEVSRKKLLALKLKAKEKRNKKRTKNKDNIKFSMASTQKENKVKKKLKTKLSIRNKNIEVKIKWKEEELNLQISKSKKIKKRKIDKKLKQCVLKYYNNTSSADVLVMPEKDVTPLKRKYVKNDKTRDNLKQTSIQNFFKVTPKE